MSFQACSQPHAQSAKNRCEFSANEAKPAWLQHAGDWDFPKHRCCWDERSKEVQPPRRQHTLLWSLPATLLLLSKLNKPSGEHTPKQPFYDALSFTAQQSLKQEHLKSPGWSRDSSFQPPITKLCLRLQWALSPQPACDGMLFHGMHTTRWQDTQPNLYWGGEGENEALFLGCFLRGNILILH